MKFPNRTSQLSDYHPANYSKVAKHLRKELNAVVLKKYDVLMCVTDAIWEMFSAIDV
jgi:hypothetical protein